MWPHNEPLFTYYYRVLVCNLKTGETKKFVKSYDTDFNYSYFLEQVNEWNRTSILQAGNVNGLVYVYHAMPKTYQP